jgi:DNA-binding response OmpR family regulator
MADRGRILVVDDDVAAQSLVKINLELDGFDVTCVADGQAALDALATERFDLVLLDLLMPGLSGLSTLGRIRDGDGPPVIVLSGVESEDTHMTTLQLGAEDFVIKPLSPAALLEQIRVVLRRTDDRRRARHQSLIPGAALFIDYVGRDVWQGESQIQLTEGEFDLLAHLARAPGRVFSRAQLLEAVSPSAVGWRDEAIVEACVSALRTKLETDPSRPRIIRTVDGVGYRFERPNFPTHAPRPLTAVGREVTT